MSSIKLTAPVATSDYSTIRTVKSAERKIIEIAATAAFYNRSADDAEACDTLALLTAISATTEADFTEIMDGLSVQITKRTEKMIREGKAVEAWIASQH